MLGPLQIFDSPRPPFLAASSPKGTNSSWQELRRTTSYGTLHNARDGVKASYHTHFR